MIGAVIDSTMMISHTCSARPPPRVLKCTIDAKVTIQAQLPQRDQTRLLVVLNVTMELGAHV